MKPAPVVAEDAFSVNATASTQNNLPFCSLILNNTEYLHTLFPAQKKHPQKRVQKGVKKSQCKTFLLSLIGAAYRRPSGRMVTNCHTVCYHKFRFYVNCNLLLHYICLRGIMKSENQVQNSFLSDLQAQIPYGKISEYCHKFPKKTAYFLVFFSWQRDKPFV